MGFRDKISEAKDAASEAASDAKEAASEKSSKAKERVTDSIPDTDRAEDVLESAKEQAAKSQTQQLGDLPPWVRVTVPTPEISYPDLSPDLSGLNLEARKKVHEKLREYKKAQEQSKAQAYASMSYDAFSSNASKVMLGAPKYGGKAVKTARQIDYRNTYRYGKMGLKYGGKYGDYVPIAGDFLPYVGFFAGVGIGVVDSVDFVSADRVVDVTDSVSNAADEVIESDDEEISKRLATGGVAFADSHLGEADEDGIDDLLDMDYNEFKDLDV